MQFTITRNCIVFLRNRIVLLEIVNCRKWPISATRDLVRDRVFCDRDRVIVDRYNCRVPFKE